MPRALLVDDDGEVRACQREVLQADGWDVLERADADEAIVCMRECKPDVVLLALHPPRMAAAPPPGDGGRRSLRAIPRVVVSGGADPVERRFALGLGAAAWLSSPVDAARLLAAAWDHRSDASVVGETRNARHSGQLGGVRQARSRGSGRGARSPSASATAGSVTMPRGHVQPVAEVGVPGHRLGDPEVGERPARRAAWRC